jgi:hypothetical protein
VCNFLYPRAVSGDTRLVVAEECKTAPRGTPLEGRAPGAMLDRIARGEGSSKATMVDLPSRSGMLLPGCACS